MHKSFCAAVVAALLSVSIGSPVNALPLLKSKRAVCIASLSLLGLGVAGVEIVPRYAGSASNYLHHRAPWNGEWQGVTRLSGGKLTPFWAQEYIGADLVRERVESFSSKPLGQGLVIGIYGENYFEDLVPSSRVQGASSGGLQNKNEHRAHGTGVINLVASDEAVGVYPYGSVQLVLSESDYRQADIINYSRYVSPHAQNLIERIDGKIDVAAVGNKIEDQSARFRPPFTELVKWGAGFILEQEPPSFTAEEILRLREEMNKNQGDFDAIFVGSIDPDGQVSAFLNPEVHPQVFAPGGNLVLSINREENFAGPYSRFVRNSPSPALVSGALAYVVERLPGITEDQIQIMINKTQIPIPGSQVGLINAFRLRVTAERLAYQWETLFDHTERSQLLSNDRPYFFRVEARGAYKMADEMLEAESSLEDIIKAYRLSFYYYPTQEAAAQLAKYYRQAGLEINAKFFERVHDELPAMNDAYLASDI